MRTRPLLAALGGAVALGVAVAASALAPASGGTIDVPVIPSPTSATITLLTNSDSTGDGIVRYLDSNGYGASQTLSTASSSSCTMTGASGPVLAFTGTATTITGAAPVGFAKTTSAGSIGINAQNGTACSQVNYSAKASSASEALRVTVPDSFAVTKTGSADKTVTGLKAVGVTFDLESKGSVVVKAEFYAGTTLVDTRMLYTGQAAVPTGATNADKCDKTGKDTGPDSGSGDNCQWSVSPAKAFTSVLLTPTAGASVALEGGGDWGATADANRTVIQLTDGQGILPCDGTTGDLVSNDGGKTAIKVDRLDNGDGSTCIKIPYKLDARGEVCQFTKPLDSQLTAQFLLTCVRTMEPTATLKSSTNDYSGGSPVVAAPAPSLLVVWPDGTSTQIPLTFCPADLWTPTAAKAWNYTWLDSHKASTADYWGTDMSAGLTGLQYACVKSETSVVLDAAQTLANEGITVNDGSVRVTDVVYLTGDILLTTKR